MYKNITSPKKFKYILKAFRKQIIPLLISLSVLEQERREQREGGSEGGEKEKERQSLLNSLHEKNMPCYQNAQ